MPPIPSPEGWQILRGAGSEWAFTTSPALSEQSLEFTGDDGVLVPDASSGSIEQFRLDYSYNKTNGSGSEIAYFGAVFARQDANNFIFCQATVDTRDIEQFEVYKVVNGSGTQIKFDEFFKGLSFGWTDIRFQVFKESSGRSFRLAAADHGNSLSVLSTITVDDTNLPFTAGDAGIWVDSSGETVQIDGDEIGTGGRPIRMYWP